MLIYSGGISGVGKTTLIDASIPEINKLGYESRRISGLPILCSLSGLSPEGFRLLKDKERAKYRDQMYEIIYGNDLQAPEQVGVLDGHFIYPEVNGEYYSTRTIQPQDYSQLIGIILIQAHPNIILARRKAEIETRPDRGLQIETIQRHQELELSESFRQAHDLSIPHIIIENNFDLNLGKESLANAIITLVGQYKLKALETPRCLK